MQVSSTIWILFNLAVVVMLAADLFFHRKSKEIKVKEALFLSAFWISLALLFNLYIYWAAGKEAALAFLTGYLVEKALSVDNLFVILLIFQYFQTPPSLQHKVLFWGVLGAIVLRGIFIFLGIAIIQYLHWMLYVFGAFLIFTGISFFFKNKKEVHPEKNLLLRIFCKFFPVTHDYHSDRFFLKIQRRLVATPLFIALIVIETTDIVFAIDSIPVILGITLDPFIVYTSNIFAILGLRSLFFALAHLMQFFYYLYFGLALILILIGIKMIVADFIHIPVLYALGSVVIILLGSILLSIFFPRSPSK